MLNPSIEYFYTCMRFLFLRCDWSNRENKNLFRFCASYLFVMRYKKIPDLQKKNAPLDSEKKSWAIYISRKRMIVEDIFLRYYQISRDIELASIRDLYLVAHLCVCAFRFICIRFYDMYNIKSILFVILELLNTARIMNVIARDKRYSEGNSTC